jgi:hypothetical protein
MQAQMSQLGKELCEARHPETKKDATGRRGKRLQDAISFIDDAAKNGRSAKSSQDQTTQAFIDDAATNTGKCRSARDETGW